jgi:hypothetical protein
MGGLVPIGAVVRKLPLIREIAVAGISAVLMVGAGARVAHAATAGVLPPRNPSANCDRANASQGDWGVASINACRALEGVGPLTLPRNWNSLGPVQQGFVLIDLERVNRGLRPIVGLSSALNQLASAGAAQGNDPSFPSGGFVGGGAIWAGVPSVLAADYLWMYDDGANGLSTNLACPSAGAAGCWAHRDIILWNRTSAPLVAGGGYSNGSIAYVVLSGYSAANLTFTWAGELHYFTTPPTVEWVGKAAARASRRHRKPTKGRHPKHRGKHPKHRGKHPKHRGKHPKHRGSAAAGAGGGLTISFG